MNQEIKQVLFADYTVDLCKNNNGVVSLAKEWVSPECTYTFDDLVNSACKSLTEAPKENDAPPRNPDLDPLAMLDVNPIHYIVSSLYLRLINNESIKQLAAQAQTIGDLKALLFIDALMPKVDIEDAEEAIKSSQTAEQKVIEFSKLYQIRWVRKRLVGEYKLILKTRADLEAIGSSLTTSTRRLTHGLVGNLLYARRKLESYAKKYSRPKAHYNYPSIKRQIRDSLEAIDGANLRMTELEAKIRQVINEEYDCLPVKLRLVEEKGDTQELARLKKEAKEMRKASSMLGYEQGIVAYDFVKPIIEDTDKAVKMKLRIRKMYRQMKTDYAEIEELCAPLLMSFDPSAISQQVKDFLKGREILYSYCARYGMPAKAGNCSSETTIDVGFIGSDNGLKQEMSRVQELLRMLRDSAITLEVQFKGDICLAYENLIRKSEGIDEREDLNELSLLRHSIDDLDSLSSLLGYRRACGFYDAIDDLLLDREKCIRGMQYIREFEKMLSTTQDLTSKYAEDINSLFGLHRSNDKKLLDAWKIVYDAGVDIFSLTDNPELRPYLTEPFKNVIRYSEELDSQIARQLSEILSDKSKTRQESKELEAISKWRFFKKKAANSQLETNNRYYNHLEEKASALHTLQHQLDKVRKVYSAHLALLMQESK